MVKSRNYFRLIPFNCKNNGIIFMHKTKVGVNDIKTLIILVNLY